MTFWKKIQRELPTHLLRLTLAWLCILAFPNPFLHLEAGVVTDAGSNAITNGSRGADRFQTGEVTTPLRGSRKTLLRKMRKPQSRPTLA